MINNFRRNLGGIGRKSKARSSHDTVLNSIIEYPRICSVTFKRNDGVIRKVWGRANVMLNGKPSLSDENYILFYDFGLKDFRRINRNNIIAVNGLNLKIEG